MELIRKTFLWLLQVVVKREEMSYEKRCVLAMGWNLSGLTGSLEAKLHGQEVEGTA